MTQFEKSLAEANWGTQEAYAYQVLKFLNMKTVLSIRKLNTLNAILKYCKDIGLKFYNNPPKLPTEKIPYGDTYYLYVALRPDGKNKYIQIKRKLEQVPSTYKKEPFDPIFIPEICYNLEITKSIINNKNKKVELVKEENNKLTSETKEIIENSLKILEALNNNLKKLL